MGMQEWGYGVLSGSPIEQFTTSGAEATVRYVGPSNNRIAFIRDVVGAWNVFGSGLNRCAKQWPIASPYAYPTVLDGSGGCTGEYCLYPDTFSGQPADDNQDPVLSSCPVANDLLKPIIGSCSWEYTVNYRYRNHARLPAVLMSDVTTTPPIPFGTYTDVRVTTGREYMTTSGRFWQYEPDAYGTDDGPWEWCPECGDNKAATKISNDQDDVPSVTSVNSIEFEVTWDNVPLPPWDIIRRANGCVNEYPIFGFPRGAVLFEFGEPEITGLFGCMEVYRLRYIFKVKTAQAMYKGSSSFIASHNDGEIIRGTIGIWNRRWSSCPIKLGTTDFFTHWIPLRGITDESTAACAGADALKTRPFEHFPHHLLFAMNVCGCTGEEVETSACAEPFVALKVDRIKSEDGSPWWFENMSETTAGDYEFLGLGVIEP